MTRIGNIMGANYHTGLRVIIVISILLAIGIAAKASPLLFKSIQLANAIGPGGGPHISDGSSNTFERAPIATSGDNNVYVSWWSNKTGNDEVMFKASTDGGKTFSNKINLSNTPRSDSQDAEIAASGNNVYVSWWERNQTMNEPVMRISNDNGKTFGEKIMLSAK
jgi:hypothetical protein